MVLPPERTQMNELSTNPEKSSDLLGFINKDNSKTSVDIQPANNNNPKDTEAPNLDERQEDTEEQPIFINAEVVAGRQMTETIDGRHKKIPAWNYACAIRHNDQLIPVGIVFDAPFKVENGAVIKVQVDSINQFHDEQSQQDWFNWWGPKADQMVYSKTDDMTVVKKVVKQSDGKISNRPFPKKFQDYVRTGRLTMVGDGALWEESYLLNLMKGGDK